MKVSKIGAHHFIINLATKIIEYVLFEIATDTISVKLGMVS